MDAMIETLGFGYPGPGEWVVKMFPLFFVGIVLIVVGWFCGKDIEGGGTCGACGYQVRGLSGLRCPECGSDLREVGIKNKKEKNGLLIKIGIAFLVVPLGLLVLGGVLAVLFFN